MLEGRGGGLMMLCQIGERQREPSRCSHQESPAFVARERGRERERREREREGEEQGERGRGTLVRQRNERRQRN